MTVTDQPFSRRHGFTGQEPEIRIRYEAPANFRFALITLARRGGLDDRELLDLLSEVLLVRPQGNWSANYIREEVDGFLDDVDWPKVYDCAESIYLRLDHECSDPPAHYWFERELNAFFVANGFGWKMTDGAIGFRGPRPLEDEIALAVGRLEDSGRRTALRELAEARKDLSRRPDPDVTGSIQHSLASLECLARDMTDDPKATFGALISRNPNLFPAPLDKAMSQLWGYASEFARHLREGREPALAEAMLIVGLAASASAFLLEREDD